jgi:HAD superfamily hydrolase (TIGR02253 family)
MIKAVVFDLDNTLVDFMKMKESAVAAAVMAMTDCGLRVPPDSARRSIYDIYKRQGIEYQRVFDVFLTRELGAVDPRMKAAGIVAYRKAREAALVPYPHVTLTLAGLLKRGLRLGVVSDAPREEAWLRLCYLGFQHLFDHVVTFEDTGARKPSPQPFREILRRMKAKPREALMVGDWAERDIAGARKVGMRTAFARYGNTPAVGGSGADYDLMDIAQLLEIVDDGRKRAPSSRPRR